MASEPGRATWREQLHFFGRFLRNPRDIGAVAPSSRVLARAMVDGLELDGAVRVVELGPGMGSFTAAIRERLGPSGRLLAIDVEPTFVASIQRRWPGVDVVCASASTLPELAAARGLVPVDHVISGLPFASLPGPVTRGILQGIEKTLRPGGTFTAFQYVYSYGLPAAIAFRRDMNARMGGRMTARLVMRNIPPAFVLRWQRRGTGLGSET
jgi:phospholipid N-methyltransferase